MSPTRLVIIAILIYIGYLLIRGGRKKETKTRRKTESRGPATVADVLVEDPVCHSLVPKQQSIHLQHHDEMIYFCSEECCQKFIEENNM